MLIEGNNTRAGLLQQLQGATRSGPLQRTSAHPSADTFIMGQALNKLKGADSTGVNTQELGSALNKMASCIGLLAGAEALDSAVAQIMREQGKQSDDACTRAEGTIKDNYTKMKHQTLEKRRAVEKQREALEDKNWWEDIVSVFKKVFDLGASVVGGVASACAGNPVGVISAALKIAGFVVSESGDDDTARWTGFGLSTAGGLLGAFSDGGGAEKVAQKVGDVGNGIVKGVATYAIGECDHDAIDANADLQDIRADRRRAQNVIEQEQELIKAYVEAQTKGIRLASNILKTNQRVARTAMNES